MINALAGSWSMVIDRLNHSDAFEVDEAARVVMKAHSNYHEISQADYLSLVFPDLVRDLKIKPVVIGKGGLDILAVYEIPFSFERERNAIALGMARSVSSSPFGGVTYDGSIGFFDTLDGRLETAQAFFGGFGEIVEHLASLAGLPIIHRDAVAHTALGTWLALGYSSVHASPGLPFNMHTMERTYEPRVHALPPGALQIADGLHRFMTAHLNNLARKLPAE
ncbi:hypothetical protein HYV85_04085 [Candidatus Woesearchaeota archaeon]|nr:hypothetical protein [Candidatus Woesearchaeota archaeon]